MSIYQKLGQIATKFGGKHLFFKYGFNFSPMYRRSTARVTHVDKDLKSIRVKLPISYKNRNYVSSIFGGSMFSAVDPFPMVQLINLLGDDYVVWDKSAKIIFKRPAYEKLFATFTYTDSEVERIKAQVAEQNEIEFKRTNALTNKTGEIVFCEVEKTLYVANKAFFKAKRKARKQESR
ncbi:MAG: DUF4442 domain-containing protein [Bacteroidota bacterium]